MFIAVIVSALIEQVDGKQQENIGVTEEEKRKEQIRAFIEKAVPTLTNTENYGYGRNHGYFDRLGI